RPRPSTQPGSPPAALQVLLPALTSVMMLTGQQPAQPPARPPAAGKEEPSYLDINLGLKDVDLADLLKRLEVTVPFRVGGRLTVRVHAAFPVNTPGDFKTYRLDGNATLSHFRLEDLEMEQVQARLTYRDGVLKLEELSGRFPATGAVVGQDPPGDFPGTSELR